MYYISKIGILITIHRRATTLNSLNYEEEGKGWRDKSEEKVGTKCNDQAKDLESCPKKFRQKAAEILDEAESRRNI